MTDMKLRLTLIILCLFWIGLFAKSQEKKRAPIKPTVENGADPIPVIVTGNKKAHPKPPPPPPPPPPKDHKVVTPQPPPPPKVAKADAKSLPTPPPPPIKTSL